MTHVGIGRLARWLAGFSSLILAAPLFADSQARIVRLSDLEGNVQIDRRAGDGFESALENLPVLQGTRISTKGDGRAEIEFEDGSTVRLAPNTSIEFTRLSLHDSGGKNTEVEVSEGTAYFNISPGKRDDFVVDIGHRSINLEHPARFRAALDPSQAHVSVSHGQVDLSGQGSETISVSKGRTASFDLLDQDKYDVARDYEAGPYDEWNQSLDDYHSRNFHQASREAPYAYGFSDLNYYGSYISDPSFGSCWRPYFAGYGWDPFTEGTWVWYPGAGYTWVSSYPWGWAPYRYGSWNFAQASGWCWQPGAWNQWVSVPTFGRPRLGYQPPAPPTNGHGRVARIHEGPVAGDGGSRFGDPTRRVVREGLDGGVIVATGPPREAGLGVPRGRVNLRTMPTPPTSESRSYLGDQRDSDHRARGSGAPVSAPQGRPSGPSSAPRSAPAPRMSPPPPPHSAPAPRGGKGL